MRCIDLDERPDPQRSDGLTPEFTLLTQAVQVPGIANASGITCSDGISVRNAANLHKQTRKSIDEWSCVFEPRAVNDRARTVPGHPQYGMHSRDTQLLRLLDCLRGAPKTSMSVSLTSSLLRYGTSRSLESAALKVDLPDAGQPPTNTKTDGMVYLQ